jgi:hypothetical protein
MSLTRLLNSPGDIDRLDDVQSVSELLAQATERQSRLTTLQLALIARLVTLRRTPIPVETCADEDRLLCVDEAASILKVTPQWLYRHSRQLPFSRRLSRKALRFSEQGLRRWVSARRVG